MIKHGYATRSDVHPLYLVWKAFKHRCSNDGNKQFSDYGGRGIGVCDEWMNPKTFIEWAIGNGWEEGLYIDRINNDGNYESDNCRFVTQLTSIHNQRLLRRDNISGYRGVSWSKSHKKWHSQICINGKKHLGFFDSPRLAAIAYDVAVYKLNDGRPTNFF